MAVAPAAAADDTVPWNVTTAANDYGSERTAFELYGGATDAGQELHANFGLKWALIREMRSRGVAEYDMNGLLNDGISQFKRSFADHEDVLVGPLDVPFSATYPLWVRGVPLAKRALRAVRRG